MSFGPEINQERTSHACGIIKYMGKNHAIITGGIDAMDEPVYSTEIWDPTSNSGWIEGKYIFAPVKFLLTKFNTNKCTHPISRFFLKSSKFSFR